MNKKYLIIVLILLVLGLIIGDYYWLQKKNFQSSSEQINIPQEVLTATDTSSINPMESAQSVNPYDKTNPFSNVKVNPFQ